MKTLMIASALLIAFAASAHAEIEKIGTPNDQGICLAWWPKLPAISGWHHDRDYSIRYSFNALTPDGETFSNADTVMYASALFKPRVPEVKTLEMLIENDKKRFAESTPGVTITEVASMGTADGKHLRSFTFQPEHTGNWERVSFGEEGDFYLVFTLSARTREGFDKNIPKYEELIKNYRETP